VGTFFCHTAHSSESKVDTHRLFGVSRSPLAAVYRLERVPRANLHHAGVSLDLGEVGPVVRGIQTSESRIASDAESGAAPVDESKALMVCYVEHVPPELKLVLLVIGHIKRFCQAKIHVGVSRQADVVAWAGFTRIRVPEVLIDGFDIATGATKELRRARTDR
jgi:hypothetical protein